MPMRVEGGDTGAGLIVAGRTRNRLTERRDRADLAWDLHPCRYRLAVRTSFRAAATPNIYPWRRNPCNPLYFVPRIAVSREIHLLAVIRGNSLV